jgi:hypothetical protein
VQGLADTRGRVGATRGVVGNAWAFNALLDAYQTADLYQTLEAKPALKATMGVTAALYQMAKDGKVTDASKLIEQVGLENFNNGMPLLLRGAASSERCAQVIVEVWDVEEALTQADEELKRSELYPTIVTALQKAGAARYGFKDFVLDSVLPCVDYISDNAGLVVYVIADQFQFLSLVG